MRGDTRETALGRLSARAALPARRGAEPLLRLATIADSQTVKGVYLNRLTPEDADLARKLWERSAQLTA